MGNGDDTEIRVKNFLCYQEGNVLCKVTEIYFEGKVLRIQDKLEINEKTDLNEFKAKAVKGKDKVRIFAQDQVNKL